MHATFPVYLLPLDLIALIIPDLILCDKYSSSLPTATPPVSVGNRSNVLQQPRRSGTWQLSGTIMGLYHVVLFVTSGILHKNPEPTSKTESRHPCLLGTAASSLCSTFCPYCVSLRLRTTRDNHCLLLRMLRHGAGDGGWLGEPTMKGSSYTAWLNKSEGIKQWPPRSPALSDVILFVGLYQTGSPQIKTKTTISPPGCRSPWKCWGWNLTLNGSVLILVLT